MLSFPIVAAMHGAVNVVASGVTSGASLPYSPYIAGAVNSVSASLKEELYRACDAQDFQHAALNWQNKTTLDFTEKSFNLVVDVDGPLGLFGMEKKVRVLTEQGLSTWYGEHEGYELVVADDPISRVVALED